MRTCERKQTSGSFHFEVVDILGFPVDGGPGVLCLGAAFARAHNQVDGVRLVQVELTALLLTSVQREEYGTCT